MLTLTHDASLANSGCDLVVSAVIYALSGSKLFTLI